ncbi:MAG: DUF4093 domain-containing protein [Clostridia bacterium]|nr:DUF4093 domain-containing protein [Clostridia bacterium]
MIKIKEALVVEGNYDKIKLSRLFDTTIVVTDGFMIFKNKSMMNMLKKLADKNGIIIFTDSDRAGFQIRNYIKNILKGKNVKHAYIPDIKGKERRKDKPSKEGFLGVEGVSDDIIIEAVKNASTVCEAEENKRLITKADLCSDGLCGLADSHIKRTAFLKSLGLPVRMSSNMMLDCLNSIYGYDEYKNLVSKIK